MKKIFAKDKKNRNTIKNIELQHFILKQISNDSNFSKIITWNSFNKLTNLSNRSSKTYASNRCVKTINKKTFNKLSNFSRPLFFKLLKSGCISGMRKSSW
jgi:ribosomal protein S14